MQCAQILPQPSTTTTRFILRSRLTLPHSHDVLTHYLLSATDDLLSATHCPLHTTHYILLTAVYSRSTIHYFLQAPYYSLLNINYSHYVRQLLSTPFLRLSQLRKTFRSAPPRLFPCGWSGRSSSTTSMCACLATCMPSGWCIGFKRFPTDMLNVARGSTGQHTLYTCKL